MNGFRQEEGNCKGGYVMKYRTFRKTGQDISVLGFGTMRMPVLPDGNLDEAASVKLIRKAIDLGINYVDTAYMYHRGLSETVVGKALKDGYREKVILADKMPVIIAKEEDDVKAIFENQFRRLDVDIIDFYLLHNVNIHTWKTVKKLNMLPFLERQRDKGRIRQIGFSFHDSLELFKEVIDAYPWDFCQIQLNYMDIKHQAGLEGLKYAASKGIQVVVMEPLKGGKLTDIVPPTVAALWQEAPIKRTPAEWGFRWVCDFPEVLTVLSGMHNQEQLVENVNIADSCEANTLTAEEKGIIEKVAAEYNSLIKYSCTSCQYCMPCTVKLNIPLIIDFFNQWHLYGGNEKIKKDYRMWVGDKRKASTCIECGACEEHCPQQLPIIKIMKEAAELFD